MYVLNLYSAPLCFQNILFFWTYPHPHKNISHSKNITRLPPHPPVIPLLLRGERAVQYPLAMLLLALMDQRAFLGSQKSHCQCRKAKMLKELDDRVLAIAEGEERARMVMEDRLCRRQWIAVKASRVSPPRSTWEEGHNIVWAILHTRLYREVNDSTRN